MSKKDTATSVGNIQVHNYLVDVSQQTEAALVLGTKEVVVEQVTPRLYNSIYVRLQLLIDAHALYDGQVTGKHYDWARAGSVVAVDARDAPYLLEKRIKSQSCCSGSDNAVFQIAN